MFYYVMRKLNTMMCCRMLHSQAVIWQVRSGVVRLRILA